MHTHHCLREVLVELDVLGRKVLAPSDGDEGQPVDIVDPALSALHRLDPVGLPAQPS